MAQYYTNLTADQIAGMEQQAAELARQWGQSNDEGEKARLHQEATAINSQLGRTFDSHTGTWSPTSVTPYPTSSINPETYDDTDYDEPLDEYRRAQSDYEKRMEEAARQQEAALKAATDKAVNDLSAQKGKVQQAGAAANQAAQKNYMDVINPNGATAEQLAALGLRSSGLTETSQISAGNTYQSAVNSNNASVQEQLNNIDLAIADAQYNGNIEVANMLAEFSQAVAQQGVQNANAILSFQQWAAQAAQSQKYNAYQLALAEAELTGVYQGQQTQAGKANEAALTGQNIQNQIYQVNLDILKQYGIPQAEAELMAQQYANEGVRLQNQYYKAQMGY